MKATRGKEIPWMGTARDMSEGLLHAGRSVWLAGLGSMVVAQDWGREKFETLVEKGEKLEKDEKNLVARNVKRATREAKSWRHTAEEKFQEATGAVLHRLGVPTHDEITTLIARVDQLSTKVQRARATR